MLACEARPGCMWLHELMLKTVVSFPQSSNDCVFGSDLQNTPLKAVMSVCWDLAGPFFCGGVSVFSLQTKNLACTAE